MKRSYLVCILIIVGFSGLFAVPLTASWVEGDVSVKSGTKWQELFLGDSLDSSALVRLGPGSLAEFTSGSRKIALSSEGSFNLDSLLQSSGAQVQKRSAVISKLGRMVDNQTPRSSVVAGVRGEFEGTTEKTEWAVDDDPEVLAADARRYLEQNNFVEAAKLFGEASMEAYGEQKDEYTYSQAWCLAASENVLGAIKILRPMQPIGLYSTPRAILLARLSLDTGAYKEAVAILSDAKKNPNLSSDDAEMIKQLQVEAQQASINK
ncbi:hypothetical protein MASR2M78_19700 [Treponema sp.]